MTWSPSNPGLNIFESSSSSTTFTISGTINDDITTETVYTYTINTNGNACNVSTASVTGEITVIPRLVINVDTPLTQNQIGSSALCNDNDIKPIFFSFTSGNSPTTIVEWTDADGVSINSPGPTLNGNVLSGAINTASTESTTYFYTVIATDSNGTCVFIDSFSGTLQVAPDIIVYEDYIQDNDVTDVTCTGDIIAYSDKKLKKNIKTLDGSKVYKMRGVSFDRVDTGEAGSGVIAQEIEKILPDVVTTRDSGYKAVKYEKIVPLLIEAIKEQNKLIVQLQEEVHLLKNKPKRTYKKKTDENSDN